VVWSAFALVSPKSWPKLWPRWPLGYSGIRGWVRYQLTLHSRSLMRALLKSTVVAAAIALAGCIPDGTPTANNRHMQPLSQRMLAELEAKNMEKESPILVRIFKEEAELEVWKPDRSGRFALLKTYPICRWSGQLGPKIKQGDRQAPEGFYTITPGLMNPNSDNYLAINTGFPNAYDRANGRTGAFSHDPRRLLFERVLCHDRGAMCSMPNRRPHSALPSAARPTRCRRTLRPRSAIGSVVTTSRLPS
jgi:hypothetical protein